MSDHEDYEHADNILCESLRVSDSDESEVSQKYQSRKQKSQQHDLAKILPILLKKDLNNVIIKRHLSDLQIDKSSIKITFENDEAKFATSRGSDLSNSVGQDLNLLLSSRITPSDLRERTKSDSSLDILSEFQTQLKQIGAAINFDQK